MFYQCSDLKNITIPSSITSIESEAFRYSGLTSLNIPNNVISIGSGAFADCTGLTNVTLADGITPLSFNRYTYKPFSNCPIKTFHWGRNLVNYSSPVAGNKILTSVTIGNNVTSIGNSDFSGCTGLTNVTIPSSITSIGSQAFYGCYGLKEIHSKNPNPPTAGSNCFYDVYNTCKLYVPGGAETKYKAAAEWKKFFSITSAIIPIKADNIAIQSLVNGIAIETKEQMPVSIYNLSGQKIYESVIAGNTEIQLGKGIYIVRVNNTSAKVVVP